MGFDRPRKAISGKLFRDTADAQNNQTDQDLLKTRQLSCG